MAMTSSQQKEILRLLKCKLQSKDCDINYESRHMDFFLFRRTVNGFFRQLCLKERNALIVYYSDKYQAMRKWAFDNLPQALKSHPIFKGWQLEIGKSRPNGDRAVGFRLRNNDLAAPTGTWYSNREVVTSAAVVLFDVLEKARLLR